jgi:NADH dehydrogenase
MARFGGRGTPRRAEVDVTVIDRTSHHLFQPLLYQMCPSATMPVATGLPSAQLYSRMRRHDLEQPIPA